jgi:glycosyltransferase involved in cell wall biosynthesis
MTPEGARLRILVLSNLFPPAVQGGYELECADVVDHLRTRHEVLVLTSTRGAGAGESGVARLLPTVPPGGLARSLLAPLDALRAARTARRVLASFRPDLLYVWNAAQIPQAALRVAETTGVPVAYRVCEHWFGDLYRTDRFMRHLYGDEHGARRVWARLMRLCNGAPGLRLDVHAAVPAAVSWNSEALRRLAPAPPTVRTVLERVDHPATRRGEALVGLARRPAPVPTVACIGRVDPVKGTDVAYRALAALRDRHRVDARLVVAGQGDPAFRRRLAALAAELSITAAVEDRGQLDAGGVAALLAEAHALVAPSVWEEPAGLVCVEAALARVPVVASRVGGIPELLHEGEHALLVPPADADACAAALAAALAGGPEVEQRTERAFARAQELRLPRYLERMDAFLADALGAFGSVP